MSSGALDLSGGWKGIFHYPRLMPPCHFDADLRDHLGTIVGETFEVGDTRYDKNIPLHAFIEGQRQGHAVSFVKRYDAIRRLGTPVFYSGTVDAEGSEISGRWDLPGQWSGTFLMIRAKPSVVNIEEEVAEPVG